MVSRLDTFSFHREEVQVESGRGDSSRSRISVRMTPSSGVKFPWRRTAGELLRPSGPRMSSVGSMSAMSALR